MRSVTDVSDERAYSLWSHPYRCCPVGLDKSEFASIVVLLK